MKTLKDIKVGDILVREGLNDIIAIFVSGELVVCKSPNNKATGNFTITELEEKGYNINQEPIKEKVKDYIWLDVDNEHLIIYYKQDTVGYITPKGECFILSCHQQRDAYIQWLNSGNKIFLDTIKWKDSIYEITDMYILQRTDNTKIYDFELAVTCEACEDDNIMRYPVNNTPILY